MDSVPEDVRLEVDVKMLDPESHRRPAGTGEGRDDEHRTGAGRFGGVRGVCANDYALLDDGRVDGYLPPPRIGGGRESQSGQSLRRRGTGQRVRVGGFSLDVVDPA